MQHSGAKIECFLVMLSSFVHEHNDNWKIVFLVLPCQGLGHSSLHTHWSPGICHLLGFPLSDKHALFKWASPTFGGQTVMTFSALVGALEKNHFCIRLINKAGTWELEPSVWSLVITTDHICQQGKFCLFSPEWVWMIPFCCCTTSLKLNDGPWEGLLFI